MTSKKTRHEFLADAAITAKLNTLVQSGATKTDIIVQAIKAFAEHGNESEFSRFTAKRFDTLLHEIEAVRRDLEAARQGRMEMESDVKTILEKVAFIHNKATAKMPPPSEELRSPSHGLFGIFR